MAIPVKLKVFEGPLDLLLHLIDKNKVDIYDIPIAMITEQYMDYIRQMERSDLNLMSEFLVMAATLIDIKCRMLLPKEVNEEGEEEDPRAELVRRLIEYKLFKYISYELKDRQLDARKALYKKPTIPKEVMEYEEPLDYERLIGDLDLKQLGRIFQFIMKRQKDKIDPVRSSFGKIEKDDVNMDEKMAYVEEFARKHRHFSFASLIDRSSTKMEVVVTFLVILELMKTGIIRIAQEHLFDDIVISYIEAA